MERRWQDLEVAVDGTCTWIFENEAYRTWREFQDPRILWVKGIPGSGKSILLKHVLTKNHLSGSSEEGSVIILSCFFHNRGSSLQKTRLGLYQSLLYQLLSAIPELLDSSRILEKYFERVERGFTLDGKWSWDWKEVATHLDMFLKAASQHKPVRIFVDAVDECGASEAAALVQHLEYWTRQPANPRYGVWVCFSCRHYPNLNLQQNFSSACLEDENREDIKLYVYARLSESNILKDQEIFASIVDGAAGMFMWARLVTAHVLQLEKSKKPLDIIREKIAQLSHKDLDQIYDEILEKMQNKEKSLHLAELLCLAFRPLKLEELAWAIPFHTSQNYPSSQSIEKAKKYQFSTTLMCDELSTLSHGLAECVAGKVQFIHQSVRDYFLDTGLRKLRQLCGKADGTQNSNELAIAQAHKGISMMCLKYLERAKLYCPLRNPGGTLLAHKRSKWGGHQDLQDDFIRYCSQYWPYHARQSEAGGVDQNYLQEHFGKDSQILEYWLDIRYLLSPSLDDMLVEVSAICHYNFCSNDHYPECLRETDLPHGKTNLFHVAARFGMWSLYQELSATIGKDFNSGDNFGHTVLSLAAFGGHVDIVRAILQDERLVLEAATKSRFRPVTPLVAAVSNGHVGVVQELIKVEHGIDLNANMLRQRPSDWIQCKQRKMLRTIFKDVERIPNPIGTLQRKLKSLARKLEPEHDIPEKAKISLGHLGVPKYLSQTAITTWRCASRKIIEAEDIKPTISLAYGVSDLVVKLSGATALHFAVSSGEIEMTKMLVESRRIDINGMMTEGMTPLCFAACEGNATIANYLLAQGAHPFLGNGNYIGASLHHFRHRHYMETALYNCLNGTHRSKKTATALLKSAMKQKLPRRLVPLHLTAAAILGKTEIATALLEENPSLSSLAQSLADNSWPADWISSRYHSSSESEGSSPSESEGYSSSESEGSSLNESEGSLSSESEGYSLSECEFYSLSESEGYSPNESEGSSSSESEFYSLSESEG
ncbi:unnamed protein product [Clonostachys byssicola]|uniref:Nephrocystin 3-like N-terminal domain-containing protein n=1 Tax=Clonostachys byssicola TaxID=160290 RepID=A0A9N9Y5I2_9HYPO|nr:unnamed protein product [Clonostachys byssicola]